MRALAFVVLGCLVFWGLLILFAPKVAVTLVVVGLGVIATVVFEERPDVFPRS